jgi:hypothetical protein
MRGWQGQPHKMVEYEHWQKKNKPKCRPSGCGLQFIGGAENYQHAIMLQSSKTLFSVARVRAIRGA